MQPFPQRAAFFMADILNCQSSKNTVQGYVAWLTGALKLNRGMLMLLNTPMLLLLQQRIQQPIVLFRYEHFLNLMHQRLTHEFKAQSVDTMCTFSTTLCFNLIYI